MTHRLLVALLVGLTSALTLAPTSARAGGNDDSFKAAEQTPTKPNDDNPYKSVKEGDYATYKMKIKVGPLDIEGTTTQTVVAKTDREATIRITATINGMETPPQEQKIDLTKPYDPTKVGSGLPAGAEASVEKLKDGQEKIKVAGKEYKATWTTYKIKAKVSGVELEGEAKTWMSDEVPMGLVKMESTMSVMKMEMKMTMELTETGNKAGNKK